MAQATTVDMKLVKRSILLVDIVDYSELDGPEQVAAIEKLNAAVRSALKALYKKGLRKKDVKCLPTGDGMFIAVPTGIEVLDLARGIHATPGSFRAVLKIGINEGYVFIVRDIEDRPNLFGAGINFAARVESCCAGGHILVADTVAKDLLTANQQLKSDFKGPYTFRVKHDKPVTAYNYYRLDEFGLADEPMKNRIPENINYEPLIDRLVARGLRPSGALQEAVFASRLSHNHNPIFGDMFQLTWETEGQTSTSRLS